MPKHSPQYLARAARFLDAAERSQLSKSKQANTAEGATGCAADNVVNLPTASLPLVTLVIPGYNEAGVLARNLAAIFGYLHSLRHRWRFEVLLINDGSSDATGEIAERLTASYPQLRVIHHPVNFGLGQALKTAFAASQGDYVVTLDLDLSYSVRTIVDLLEAIEGSSNKIVLASPYIEGGRTTNVPRLRLTLSRWANRMFSWLSGNSYNTFTCMVRAYDGPFIRALQPKAQGMAIMPEIIYKTMILGGKIAELPAHLDWSAQVADGTQRSSSMRLLSHIAATSISGFVFRPNVLLMLPGLACLIVSIALGLSLWLSAGSVLEHPALLIFASLGILLGVQMLSMSAMSLQNKKYYEETYFQLVKLRRQIDIQTETASPAGDPLTKDGHS